MLSFIKSKVGGLVRQWGGGTALFFSYTHLSHDLTTGLLVALLPFIRQDLELNYLQSGLLVSAFSLTSGVSQLLGGWVSDRISRNKAIALGLGGVGVSATLLGLAPSYYPMLAILVAMGIFAGFYHPSAVSTLTNYFEPKQRGRVIAMHMLGGSLGFGTGPFLGAVISSSLSWHFAFIFLGIPAVVAALLVLTRLKLPPPIQYPADVASSKVAGQKPASVARVFLSAAGIIGLSVLMQLITGPVMSFIPLFLVDVHHLTAAAASTWLTVVRIGGMVGSLFGGWLTDKWGRRRAILLALILFGPVVLLVSKLPFGVALAAAFVLFGWLMSMRETTMQTYLMDSAPPQLRATVFGIYFGFGQEGSSLVQPLAGNFMDMAGIAGVFNAIAYISTVLSMLALLLFFRKNRIREPGEPDR